MLKRRRQEQLDPRSVCIAFFREPLGLTRSAEEEEEDGDDVEEEEGIFNQSQLKHK